LEWFVCSNNQLVSLPKLPMMLLYLSAQNNSLTCLPSFFDIEIDVELPVCKD